MPIEISDHKKSQNDETPDAYRKVKIKLTSSELNADPSLAICYMIGFIKEKRWFLEKDADIDGVFQEDSFRLIDNNEIVEGIIISFHLKKFGSNKIKKRYFIPIVISDKRMSDTPSEDQYILNLADGNRYFSFAEHSNAFQKAMISQFKKSGTIVTTRGGTLQFRPMGHALINIDETKLTVSPLGLTLPSSNILTKIESYPQSVVSKIYKDMRGVSNKKNKIWLPNLETKRYEALTKSGYTNVSELYGILNYKTPNGEQIQLGLMMEEVLSEGKVGEVFAKALTRFFNTLDSKKPFEFIKRLNQTVKGIQFFAYEVARTIARMHKAFLKSGKAGFNEESATHADIYRWSSKIFNDFNEAMKILTMMHKEQPNATFLSILTDKLTNLLDLKRTRMNKNIEVKKWSIAKIIFSLNQLEGLLMKAQIHGDLHADQGLIKKAESKPRIDEFLNAIQNGDDTKIRIKASQLVRMIKWIDFEGTPAKVTVDINYDSRENILVDLAGMIQSLWYILNIKLYEYLNLRYKNYEHHEIQRKVSLFLAGQLSQEQLDIPGLSIELIDVLNLWYKKTTTSLIKGYIDEIEAQNIQNAVLKKWDQDIVISIIDYWVLTRSIHELRYETYGRNWGWEAIAGSKIIQIMNSIDIAGLLKNKTNLKT